ncbi:MAG: ABC transporter permease [Rhizobacter sp.]|nr:ABC transporter permease [Ferruginibacter sp.]
MRKTLNILASSLRLTLQELKNNKLRTSLSLTGIAFGIFCIIGVLAFVTSLERNIQNEIASLGTNTIYVDKWSWNGGGDIPFWKIRSRPLMKFEEAQMIKDRSDLTESVAYFMSTSGSISYKNDELTGVNIYGINPAQIDIQPMEFLEGRYFSAADFNNATSVAIIGYNNAEKLYGSAERALGKMVEIKGRMVNIVGVIAKAGKGGAFEFDECLMLPYKFCKQLYEEKNTNPLIIVKGKKDIPTEALSDELRGIMRQIRRLSPMQEDNFALNSVEAISKAVSGFFVILNIVGSIIGGISLVVGMFGIANIMFVTVKERTPVIGLKKAIGAKSSTVLFEFLAEAALLCLMGGAVGIFFVWILTMILSGPLEFPVYISLPLLGMTVVICLVVGILAGIIPARRAAKMDPVVAIRS